MIEQSPRPAIDAGTTQLTAIIRRRRLSRYADSARISHGSAESNVGANSVRTQKLPSPGVSQPAPEVPRRVSPGRNVAQSRNCPAAAPSETGLDSVSSARAADIRLEFTPPGGCDGPAKIRRALRATEGCRLTQPSSVFRVADP
jgi:hypothetical protein